MPLESSANEVIELDCVINRGGTILGILRMPLGSADECGVSATDQVAKYPHVAKMHASLHMVRHCAMKRPVGFVAEIRNQRERAVSVER